MPFTDPMALAPPAIQAAVIACARSAPAAHVTKRSEHGARVSREQDGDTPVVLMAILDKSASISTGSPASWLTPGKPGGRTALIGGRSAAPSRTMSSAAGRCSPNPQFHPRLSDEGRPDYRRNRRLPAGLANSSVLSSTTTARSTGITGAGGARCARVGEKRLRSSSA